MTDTATTDPVTGLKPDSAGSVHDFKVADLSLADFGRKEIELAEHEMPGLMALRRDAELRAAVEAWFEATPQRPEHVPADDWLRWEQDKHERLLAAA